MGELSEVLGEETQIEVRNLLRKKNILQPEGVTSVAELFRSFGKSWNGKQGRRLPFVRVVPGSEGLEKRKAKRNSIYCVADLRGVDVILVDDVVTTGATFDAAFRAVRKSGGRVIGGFALAMAKDPRISLVA
ncbi:phosphoribosyltransferase family protein [Arcanobacterium ihumii]|uniref:phosphoribosyltransferase family protein n=1 Tax=Arcanobacterium ihumii TaxID=2138162 RepID=UPI001358C77D|nr:phosphoribosyltransferase family protein [Arcanobacterium ihumii]